MNAQNFKDLTGQRFSMLTVLSRAKSYSSGNVIWLCQCECGTTKAIVGSSLRRGITKSCGCTKGAKISAAITRHGQAKVGRVTREHAIWRGMLSRCANPNSSGYAEYGARGIKVCDRWLTFENFFADMGPAPPGMSLDRFPNNDGGYEQNNCRWATAKMQANNRRKRRFHKKPKNYGRAAA